MGKPRKKSWSSNGDEEEGDSIFANNRFLEGLLEWMGSPEGQHHIESNCSPGWARGRDR
jgi:hypothetical protein